MVKLAIRATLVAKPGKEAAVEAFLKSALPLAMREAGTTLWFALKITPSTFGIFDAFADEAGRDGVPSFSVRFRTIRGTRLHAGLRPIGLQIVN
jgi:hypothetical protein